MKSCPFCQKSFETPDQETRLREKIVANFETGAPTPPTLCPDCRMQSLMAWRNERILYGRTCDLTKQKMIAMYPADAPFPVYQRSAWWSDQWDALSYGRDFDFNRPFFEQFADLQKVVPRMALTGQKEENCDYCNFVLESRNCYLSHNNYQSEGLLYCYWSMQSKDCVDCSYIFQSQRCFDCTDCNHSYGLISSQLAHNCSDSAFLYDCRGCRNCFGCVGLRQKEYCMFNEPLSKADYEARLQEFNLNSPEHLHAVRQRVELLKSKHPRLYSIQEKTEHCTGDYIFESKNCQNSYQIYRSQDCINMQDAESKDCVDGYHPGWSEGTYCAYSPVRQKATAFVSVCWDGSDMFYSDNCYTCYHCFGSIGLRHKKYCILNKQYSKEKYQELLPQIIKHMTKTGEWGQFFPISLSPHAYNESMASQFFVVTKADALQKGWRWRDELPFTRGKETTQWNTIPYDIAQVQDRILDEVLSCTACSRNYKIIPQELRFYREMHVALPRFCPECRYNKRSALRNSRTLHTRVCPRCAAPLQTTYSPEQPEAVYCEKCYLNEVY